MGRGARSELMIFLLNKRTWEVENQYNSWSLNHKSVGAWYGLEDESTRTMIHKIKIFKPFLSEKEQRTNIT